MRTAYIRAITLILLSALWLSACDNYSLPAQFEDTGGLELFTQKSSVVPGETIELYPNGGVEPYSYGISVESLFCDGTLGSIADHRYTAGDAIGELRIYLFDQVDNSVSKVVTTVPPTPGNFVVNGATGTNEIELSWSWADDTEIISGFEIYRSVDGGAFSLRTSLGSTETTFTDTALNVNKLYTYRMYAVSGEYVSAPTADISTYPDS